MSALEQRVPTIALRDDSGMSDVDLPEAAEPRVAAWVPVVARVVAAGIPVTAVVIMSTARPLGVEIVLLWAVSYVAVRDTRYASWLRPLAPRFPLAAVWSAAVAFVAGSLLSFWLPDIQLTPAHLLLLAVITFIAAASLELAFGGGLARRTRVLIVGDGEATVAVADELRNHPALQFASVRAVVNGASAPAALQKTILLEQPDLVVMEGDGTEIVRSILDAGLVNVRVIGLHGFYEHIVGRVPLAGLSPTWFMSVLHLYQRTYSRFVKRVFDCVFSVSGLVLFAPLLGAAALLVRLSGGSSILFRQVRLGEGGKTFAMLKFRTMREGAELPGEAIWAVQDDPRVTWAGRLLRSTHMDELPQFWNVLRGDMSIVGPRPERPEFLELLQREVPFWKRRHLVKPGITGWAQVQAGYASDVESAGQKLSYDLYYLKHQSLALDLAITAKTVAVALSRAGAR
jgi:exopolysaccharide biosynthesis polyprenyl glycosylphosphotransferase